MAEISIHRAKTNLSQLLRQVEAGEEVIISRDGVPVARLVPVEGTHKSRRALGKDRGTFTVPDDFNGPFPEEVLAEFWGKVE